MTDKPHSPDLAEPAFLGWTADPRTGFGRQTMCPDIGIASRPSKTLSRKNEDAVGVIILPSDVGLKVVLCVADGISSLELSMETSTEAVRFFLGRVATDNLHISDLLLATNQWLLNWAGGKEVGTTFTCVTYEAPQMYFGHLGDSRLYSIADGQCLCMTVDHTSLAEQSGVPAPDRHVVKASRSMLTKSLGDTRLKKDHIYSNEESSPVHMRAGDALVLCSDGVWTELDSEEIREIWHGYLLQADACNGQCFNAILRFNIGAHVGSGGILDDNSGTFAVPGFSYVKSYNNTWADFNNYPGNQLYGGTLGFTHNSTNGAVINNLFYYPQSLADFNPYDTDSGTVATFSVGHNLAWCTGSPCNIHGKVYGSGSFTSDPGNIVSNPSFVNYGANDFHLNTGSPAIGAGTSLTAAVGAGSSSTALTVADAGFFQDGYGITGVQADWIRIGASTTVQISSINYSTNVIMLASPASWSNSAP